MIVCAAFFHSKYITNRHFELGGYETWPGTNSLEPEAAVKMLDALLEMAREVAPKAK